MDDFAGHNGRFVHGSRVHDVMPQPWVGDRLVPGPACNTPGGGFDPSVFQPVTAGVSCERCRHRSATPDLPVAAPLVDPDQLALPLDPDEE